MTPYERFVMFLDFPALVPGGEVQSAWSPDGTTLAILDGGQVLRIDLVTGGRERLADVSSLGSSVTKLRWATPQTIELDHEDQQYALDLGSGRLTAVPGRDHPRVLRRGFLANAPAIREAASPDGSWFATEKDHDLWLRSADEERPLTSDGAPDNRWEVDVASWSADGRLLAALRSDTRDVPGVPLVDWLDTHERVTWHPLPRTGDRFPRLEVHVFDISAETSVRADLGSEEFFYLAPSGWLPGGELLVLSADRFDKALRLQAVDPTTGSSRTVVEERQDTYVYGIRLDKIVGNVVQVPGSPELLWFSERDGWRHVFRYAADGTLLDQVTSGAFEVESVVGFGSDAQLFVLAHSDLSRPYDVHLCAVGLDGSGFRQLSRDPGMHTAVLSPDGQWLLDTHSSLDRPLRTDLLRADGSVLTTVSAADTTALDELGWSPPDEIIVQAADGTTDLHGVIWHPPGFDPELRYPVLQFIYGGPQHVIHPRDFLQTSARLAHALAQLGMVVVSVDGRGTPERGKAFQDFGFGRFGQHQIPEHRAALQQVLADRPYLDPERVGMFGGSWGGYMTLRAMVTAPETYHVGVASYGVGELFDHMARAIEPYMGDVRNNREAYEQASSLDLLDRLQGKLLLIHGSDDVNATLSATMKIVDGLIKVDKPFDLLVVPGMEHAFIGPGSAYAIKRIGDYFQTHLGGPRP